MGKRRQLKSVWVITYDLGAAHQDKRYFDCAANEIIAVLPGTSKISKVKDYVDALAQAHMGPDERAGYLRRQEKDKPHYRARVHKNSDGRITGVSAGHELVIDAVILYDVEVGDDGEITGQHRVQ